LDYYVFQRRVVNKTERGEEPGSRAPVEGKNNFHFLSRYYFLSGGLSALAAPQNQQAQHHQKTMKMYKTLPGANPNLEHYSQSW
jgi:hypothetical protein